MPKRKGHSYIGTSGFNYAHWSDGVFYPPKLSQRKWLEYYAEHFKTVELNVTFYRLPKPEVFTGWHDRVPKDFTYFVKGSRYITHIKRLKDVSEPLKKLFDLVKHLKEKFAGVLWQTPPSMRIDLKLLESFLKKIKKYKTHHAFEFRHASWWTEEVFKLLKEYGATFVDADYVKKYAVEPLNYNFDFYYIRRHGIGGKYEGSYSKKQLKEIAEQIKSFSKSGKDAFVYFNNDAGGYAIKNATELIEITK